MRLSAANDDALVSDIQASQTSVFQIVYLSACPAPPVPPTLMANPVWADGPWPLIETPSKTQDVSKHAAIYIANEMACTHNCMIRGLNSIYLQAEHVQKPQDIEDFLFFIKSWANWVSDHHILEETQMFPGFEKVIGTAGFLDTNVEQHHAFQPQLKTLQEYSSHTSHVDYDATKVRRTIEEMAPSFYRHLSDEINSLLSMEPYDEAALLKVYKHCVAEATKQDKVHYALQTLEIERDY
ncbi:hypothetical protein PEXP_098970 [Penicillium expansum]|nr:hypothetical protein PEXP_098970 [Penicillium expansum]